MITFSLISILYTAPLIAEERIDVFPPTPFLQFLIYETLVIFWLAIIGLLILIRLKIKEIERLQSWGFYEEKTKDT